MIVIRKIDSRRLLGVRIAMDSPHRQASHPATGKADTMPRAAARHGAKIGDKEVIKPERISDAMPRAAVRQGAKIGQKGGTKPDARLRAATRHGAKIGQKVGTKTVSG